MILQKNIDRVKLPKQWRHWCNQMNLRPEYISRRNRKWLYMVGRGRRWRVNMYSQFQSGDAYADFDRWANSVFNEIELPHTFEQFQKAVLLLENKNERSPQSN
jgi:hypothetical protein